MIDTNAEGGREGIVAVKYGNGDEEAEDENW